MRKAPLILVLLLLLAPALSAKPRGARHPAVTCSFTLLPSWEGSIAHEGMQSGTAFVYGQTAECSQWGGYANVDWVTVEAAPLAAQPAAYVTVAPNPLPEPRTALLAIAGISLTITQDAAPSLTNTGLVTNGGFDRGIEGWTWQDRFPNGRGTASWSSLDAGDNPASGSILMHDDSPGLAFQRLQCMPVTGNTPYVFGAKVRTVQNSTYGEAILALFDYSSTDCSGDFTRQNQQFLRPEQLGEWQSFERTMSTRLQTRSLLVVIASAANLYIFDTWFDDVFVRRLE